MKISRIALLLCSCTVVFLILRFPAAAAAGAKESLFAFGSLVLPALLPFFIALQLLRASGIIDLIAGLFQPITRAVFGFSGQFAFIFLSSALGGYPVGARLCADLYAEGRLTGKEASLMVGATSTSGPAFIAGAVCTSLLGRGSLAPYLLIPHYGAALLVAVFLGRRAGRNAKGAGPRQAIGAFLNTDATKEQPLGLLLSGAVEGAVSTMLQVGGLIVLFGALLSCLSASGFFTLLFDGLAQPAAAIALFSGMLEMTGGCLAAKVLPLPTALIVSCGILSFGGLCIWAQTYAICRKSGLKLRGFALCKIAQGLLSAALCAAGLWLWPPALQAASAGAFPHLQPIGPLFLCFCLFTLTGIRLWQKNTRKTV